ncbi:hypothetical protein Cni_G27804 [Canna indica]|uniref:Uncharacterized protein n=1 Tax=Canna indica TaxID=4628 RepID=A0AAQ3L8F9_9LILI|nr:hypothetical protein Cni_G27804 [Canna indica]
MHLIGYRLKNLREIKLKYRGKNNLKSYFEVKLHHAYEWESVGFVVAVGGDDSSILPEEKELAIEVCPIFHRDKNPNSPPGSRTPVEVEFHGALLQCQVHDVHRLLVQWDWR